MTIVGGIVILFVLGLFFSMLGQQPKPDTEWQNDTDVDSFTTPMVSADVLEAAPSEQPVTVA